MGRTQLWILGWMETLSEPLCPPVADGVMGRMVAVCPAFDWDGVYFLPSSRCIAVLGIKYENSVDNTLTFWL